MQLIGVIERLQVQPIPLKTGEKPTRVYDPSPIMAVDRLCLTTDGVYAPMSDGQTVIDVHHADHPLSRFRGSNGISIGFTAHYEQMRAQFGGHVKDGCAGENILIRSACGYTLDDLSGTVIIATRDGTHVHLEGLRVAAPCVEFSHYVHQTRLDTSPLPASVLRATLQALGHGQRGFYAAVLPSEPCLTIYTGDAVYISR